MKKAPRRLQVLGILAVGFVIGRYTAEPHAEVTAGQQLITETEPVSVLVAALNADVEIETPAIETVLTAESASVSSKSADVAASDAEGATPAAMPDEALAPVVWWPFTQTTCSNLTSEWKGLRSLVLESSFRAAQSPLFLLVSAPAVSHRLELPDWPKNVWQKLLLPKPKKLPSPKTPANNG